ncbi:hypothetical protein B0H17DRAFT_1212759 [Mycena rosella]|uniref:Uncharacterized protein n=1 Tax=Mycena rosella TaxID=1033263 RepID=A0AAD7G5Y5_MYCRO|nr:hypothetical protein B0H17DRAFT_1212759 [Mycena rosella]
MSTSAEAAAQLIYAPIRWNPRSTKLVRLRAVRRVDTLYGVCIQTINCRGHPAKFVPGGWTGLLNPGQDNTSTFILVWTLFYGVLFCLSLNSLDQNYQGLYMSEMGSEE